MRSRGATRDPKMIFFWVTKHLTIESPNARSGAFFPGTLWPLSISCLPAVDRAKPCIREIGDAFLKADESRRSPYLF